MTPTLALADTSFFIAAESGRLIREQSPRQYKVSVVTIGELRAGVLSARDDQARAKRLSTLSKAQETEPIPVDERVAAAWAELRTALRRTGRKIATNDGWIAATAIAHKLPLATQDGDFDDLPGLDVIKL